LENFFARIERFWPQGRRDLHWHVLPNLLEAMELTRPYTGLTVHRGLCRVIPDWIHCTVLHAIGADADFDPNVRNNIQRLVDDVTTRVADVDPFTLTFGRPNLTPVAIEAVGSPGRPHEMLVEHVMGAHRAIWGDAHTLAPSRYPHASLAYAGKGAEDLDQRALEAELSGIGDPDPMTMTVDRLHLVAQYHDGARITWQSLAEVPLKGVDLDDEAFIDSLLGAE
jgi:hypothetical protein